MGETVRDFEATEYWKACLSAALIGTDRRLPVAPKGNNDLAQMLQKLDWGQPASALLNATSVIAQYQAVGKTVGSSHEFGSEPMPSELVTVEPCESDTMPCCSDRIARYLGTAISNYAEVVSELLELIATSRQRIPPEWLPALLTFGERKTALQPLIVAVLGNRGSWLAAQNPNWRYGCVLTLANSIGEKGADIKAELSTLQQQWESGSGHDRILAFKQWRSLDPSSAREALAESWKSEAWRDREAFITAMTLQLSIEDEPFLETALTDRAKSVKACAAELLATLPTSQLCQRMAERVQPLIQLHKSSQPLQIEVNLPETYDLAWERDGIKREPQYGEGEKASWLRQIIEKVPLSTWVEDPEEIVQVAESHEWGEALIDGWAVAIQQQRSQPKAKEWAAAWLYQFGAYDLDETAIKDLLMLLPAEQREVYLRSQIPKKANDQNLAHWLRLVAQENQRWNFDFSRLIVTQLIKLLKGKPKYGDRFSPPTTLALSLHPGIATEASTKIEKLLQTQHPTRAWQKFLERFLELLNLRWKIYQAFANSS